MQSYPTTADAEMTVRTMAELLLASDRLRLGEPDDGAVEVVEVLYAVRDIIDCLGAATSRWATSLTYVDGGAVGSHVPGIDMVWSLSEALQAAGLLAGQAAATVSDAIDTGQPHDD